MRNPPVVLEVTGPALSTHCAQRASWCKQCKQWPGNMSIAQVAATIATTLLQYLAAGASQYHRCFHGQQTSLVTSVTVYMMLGSLLDVCQVNSLSGNIEYITEPPATVDTSWSPCRYCGGQGTGDRIRRNYNDPANKLRMYRQPLSSIP